MAEKRTNQTAFQQFGPRRGGGPGGPFASSEQAKDVKGTLRRVLSYFAKERGLIAAMLGVVLLGTACGIWAPSLQSSAVDMIAGTREGRFAFTLGLMMATYLLYSGSQFLQDYISAHLSQRIVRRLREELFEKIVDMPVKYLDDHAHGDVMSRMTNDVENISTTVSQALPSLFAGVLMVIGTAAVMLWYCWQLTLLSFATVALTLIATKLMAGKMRQFSRERQKLLGMLNSNVEEMVSGYHTVVAYNHQSASETEFRETSDGLTKAGIRVGSLGGIFGPIMNCVSNLSFVVIAAFGGYFAIHGIISVGVISAFIIYAKQFSRPLNQIAQIYSQIQSAVAGAERVFAVLDEADEDMTGEELSAEESATVRFDHVDFGYREDTPVLKDFTVTVPTGKKVALVGATGSGKTTVVNLLMRYYDIGGGRIYVNDQDLGRVSRSDLRKKLAVVLQDTVLFTDTVRSNLTFGNPDAADEDIWRALDMSCCRSLVEAMPEGLDTVLTGAGANLSQGQRQLLAIARAFVADPKILILDEATSSVDTRTEKAIQDAMQRIMRDRTSIVIAHRLSTIRDSDVIVVVDAGRIAEQGSHDVLLAKKGKYYDLYMTQFAGIAT